MRAIPRINNAGFGAVDEVLQRYDSYEQVRADLPALFDDTD